jgi:single-strand DNA-binding protein
MAQSLNRVVLAGRLGRDAEVRYTAQGKPVATLSLATDRPVPAGAEPVTDWHRIVCWSQLAEQAAGFLTRGRLVCVVGRLTYRTYETRDGQRRRTAEVIASELIPLDRPAEPETGRPQAAGQPPAA